MAKKNRRRRAAPRRRPSKAVRRIATPKRRKASASRSKGFLRSPEVRYAGAAVAGAAVAGILGNVAEVKSMSAKIPGGGPAVAGALMLAASMLTKGNTKKLLQAAAVGAIGTVAVKALGSDPVATIAAPVKAAAQKSTAALPAPSHSVSDYLNSYVDHAVA